MGDSTGNIYFSGGSSRIPHSRLRANSDEHNILPHLLGPLPCESQFHSYLTTGERQQNISVQFMHSCPAQDATQLDSDILQRHLTFDEGSSAATTVAYPESSQRTTSHPLSPYATEASDFNYPCDHATLHAGQTFRRGSWPSHSQMGYASWMQSPQRVPRSPISEPPESTSDESYQGSDVDEVTQMSPMMNQFQIQSSRNIELPPQHMHHAQALQPSVMTFQLSETMLQLVDDREDGEMLRRSPDMSIVLDDESELANTSSSSTDLASFSIPSRLQGPSMRLLRESENPIQTSQFRVPMPSSSTIPFPSPHCPTNTRIGDQRLSGSKQQKKSKMHECQQCKKLFPRPSGLATHMNTHSGAKPYKCIISNCEKRFAVRSNAKRHLRTHGINPSSQEISRPLFTVGFEEPMVTQVHDAARQPSRYRWILHNPSSHEHEWPRQTSSSAVKCASHSAITFQPSMSSATSSSLSPCSDDGYDELASSSVANVHQSQGDYRNRETDEFSGTYPKSHRQRPHRG